MSKAETARKNRRRGKAFQYKSAKLLGAKNVGGLGGEDGEMENFSVEAKSRKAFVGRKWMEQAVRNCPEGKIPIVHVHVRGDQYVNDVVMIRLVDFKKLARL